ncbi:MAG TPA: hypothetical protein VLB68_07765 [Pyrinomonadaceae bacterium]|nr:hypothetical protein [Pyrinomonadaceae bacterium]
MEKFPGQWEVRVVKTNDTAKEFWERAITKYIGESGNPVSIEKDGKSWYLFSFESSAPPNNGMQRTRN